jgi:hypothetical protein
VRKPKADRWLQVGVAVFGAGALLVVSWLIYAKTSNESFGDWPGLSGVAISAVGLAFLIVGFFITDETSDPSDSEDSAQVRANIRGGIRNSIVQIGKKNRVR